MKTIILKGEPKSTGAIYKITCRGRFGSYYVSQQGKAVKQSYIKQTLSQWTDKSIAEDVYVNIRLYFGTKRKSDIDNFNKLLLDSMTGIVWIDDSQIQKMTIEKFYDKLDPRIELDIDIVT